jgi:hypothetical protein
MISAKVLFLASRNACVDVAIQVIDLVVRGLTAKELDVHRLAFGL